MLRQIEDLPGGVAGLCASGRVTREDYESVVEPLLEEARQAGQSLRVLCDFSSGFVGFSPGAAWQGVKLGRRLVRVFAGCAIVSDLEWVRESGRLVDLLLACPVRAFASEDRGEAVEWLGSLATGAPASERVLAESGVIVFDIQRAPRTRELDALTFSADSWILENGSLTGLVIQVRQFPGWEDLGKTLRRLYFVSRAHRKVARVALVGDGLPPNLHQEIGAHFVEAEVRSFPHSVADVATRWAGKQERCVEVSRAAASQEMGTAGSAPHTLPKSTCTAAAALPSSQSISANTSASTIGSS